MKKRSWTRPSTASSDVAAPTDGATAPADSGKGDAVRADWLAQVGIASWSIIGTVAVLAIFLAVLATISEVAIPVVMGAIVAVVIKPAADRLRTRGMGATPATGLVLGAMVAGLLAVGVGAVHGISSQTEEISGSVDDAVVTLSDELNIDQSAVADVRAQISELGPGLPAGELTALVSGVSTLVGFASGVLLALIVMYYLVRDGGLLRTRLLSRARPEAGRELDSFITESCLTLRSYAHGRTIMSGIVTVVMGVTAALLGLPLIATIMAITFIGGYIPYIGAFVAGAFTVLIALGNGGLAPAMTVLIVSLAANLLLENFVEPKVMGKSLDIHPLTVLIVTALGGLVGGIIGLIVAVPLAVIAGSAFSRMRSTGQLEQAAAIARPTAKRFLDGRSDAQENT